MVHGGEGSSPDACTCVGVHAWAPLHSTVVNSGLRGGGENGNPQKINSCTRTNVFLTAEFWSSTSVFLLPWDIWQSLETFLGVTAWG